MAEQRTYLYEDKEFTYPENFFDTYDGRLAAASQEMSIAKDMDLIYCRTDNAYFNHNSSLFCEAKCIYSTFMHKITQNVN